MQIFEEIEHLSSIIVKPMAGATARVPMSHRILAFDNCEIDFSGWPAVSLSDTIFGFLDAEGEGSPESVVSIEEFDDNEGGDGEKGSCESINDDNKTFWETQHQLLHATVRRTSSLEARIRDATKEALKEVQITGNACVCRRPVAGGCRDCLMREVCGRLQNAGYNSAICKSKWKSSPDIPSGEHTFLDVVESNPKKGEVRVIIELNFRAEFEMARASEEYKKLISNLPEVFVGKVERLHSLLKILCSAAKKCMKEMKIHMGPWRKHRYMQAKWLSTCKRTTSTAPPLPTGYTSRPPRPRASMLTLDLLENLPSLHRTVVEVV